MYAATWRNKDVSLYNSGWAKDIACPPNVTVELATAYPANPVPAPVPLLRGFGARRTALELFWKIVCKIVHRGAYLTKQSALMPK